MCVCVEDGVCVCDIDVCERWCVTMLRVTKVGVCVCLCEKRCVAKMCAKTGVSKMCIEDVVCSRRCVTKMYVKEGVTKMCVNDGV